MKIVIVRDFPFLKQWKALHSQARQPALEEALREVVGSFTRGQLPPASPELAPLAQSNAIPNDLDSGHTLIVLQSPSIHVIYWVGTKADARTWLEKHPNVRVFAVVEGDRMELSVRGDVDASDLELVQGDEPLDPKIPLLQRIQGVDWRKEIGHRGIARQLLSMTKDLDLEELDSALSQLEATKPELAALIYEVIFFLMDDNTSQARLAVEQHFGSGTVISLEENPPPETALQTSNPEQIAVLNTMSGVELDRLLDPDRFQDWMQFLHPEQRSNVDADYAQPVLLKGVSGSGKTVVVVHRALRLALQNPNARVLVLTLNADLAILIENLIGHLAGDSDPPNLQVYSLAGYFRRLITLAGIDDTLDQWKQYLLSTAPADAKLHESATYRDDIFTAQPHWYYRSQFRMFATQAEREKLKPLRQLRGHIKSKAEWVSYLHEETIYSRSLATSWTEYSEYFDIERTGRVIPFHSNRRVQAIQVAQAWERFQWNNGFIDPISLTQMALQTLQRQPQIPAELRFDHVLVDEYQDLSNLELGLIAGIPNSPNNGLFLTGDDAQRISVKYLNLKTIPALGSLQQAEIAKNYRNTKEILTAGQTLLGKQKDLPPDIHILHPQFSDRHGPPPTVLATKDQVKAAWDLAIDISNRKSLQPFSVCLLSAHPGLLSVEAILEKCPAGSEAALLTGQYFENPNAFVVSDIDSVKGFEFTTVILLGVQDGMMPSPGTPKGEQWRDALRLYAALTRARDQAFILHQGKPSRFLKDMKDAIARG